MANKGTNKGYDPGYDYSELVKGSKKNTHNVKRIYQKWRRRKLDKLIDEQLAEMNEDENNE